MKKDIWKVKIIAKHEEDFEQFCMENNIFIEPYPTTVFEGLYRVECPKYKLFAIDHCISTIEEMPIVTLS